MKLAGAMYGSSMLRYLQPKTKVELPKFGEYQQVDPILKERILVGFRSCEAYQAFCDAPSGDSLRRIRNAFGQCLETKSLFCTCCRFGSPDVVLNIMASHCRKLFDSQLYDGIAVNSLLAPEILGDLTLEQTVRDYASETYDWIQLINRHFSRMHWMAVQCEQQRLLKEWTQFICFVNETVTLQSFDQAMVDHWMNLLYPSEPPRPERGFFLIRQEHVEQMKSAVIDRVRCFFATITVPFEIQMDEEYRYVEFGEFWSLHEVDTPISPVEQMIQRLLIQPEQERRQVNACRMYCGGNLSPIRYPSNLTHFTFSNTPVESSWHPFIEEVEACQQFLDHGKTSAIWWVPFTHDMTWFKRKALIVHKISYLDCLRQLLFHNSFMRGCVVEFFPYENDDFDPGTFSIRVDLSLEDISEFMMHTMNTFNEDCVTSSIEVRPFLNKSARIVVVRASEKNPIKF